MDSPGASPSGTAVPDPSGAIKKYLSGEARDIVDNFHGASESLVLSSQIGVATSVTARRLLQGERYMENTAALLREMERVVTQLDLDVADMVESVTKLEDVGDQLKEVQATCDQLYGQMKKK